MADFLVQPGLASSHSVLLLCPHYRCKLQSVWLSASTSKKPISDFTQFLLPVAMLWTSSDGTVMSCSSHIVDNVMFAHNSQKRTNRTYGWQQGFDMATDLTQWSTRKKHRGRCLISKIALFLSLFWNRTSGVKWHKIYQILSVVLKT